MRQLIPPEISCTTANQFESEFIQISSVLALPETEETWDRLQQALQRLTALLNGGAGNFQREVVREVKTVIRPIASCLSSERGVLSGAAADLVVALTESLGLGFEPLLRSFLDPVCRMCTRPNKLFITRSRRCLFSLIENTALVAIVPHLCECLKDKNQTLRTAAADGLLQCLNMMNPPDLEKKASVIESALRLSCRDASADVRKISRSLFEAYQLLFPDRIPAFIDPLTPTTKKYLGISKQSASSQVESRAGSKTRSRSRPPPTLEFSASTSSLPTMSSMTATVIRPVAHARAASTTTVPIAAGFIKDMGPPLLIPLRRQQTTLLADQERTTSINSSTSQNSSIAASRPTSRTDSVKSAPAPIVPQPTEALKGPAARSRPMRPAANRQLEPMPNVTEANAQEERGRSRAMRPAPGSRLNLRSDNQEAEVERVEDVASGRKAMRNPLASSVTSTGPTTGPRIVSEPETTGTEEASDNQSPSVLPEISLLPQEVLDSAPVPGGKLLQASTSSRPNNDEPERAAPMEDASGLSQVTVCESETKVLSIVPSAQAPNAHRGVSASSGTTVAKKLVKLQVNTISTSSKTAASSTKTASQLPSAATKAKPAGFVPHRTTIRGAGAATSSRNLMQPTLSQLARIKSANEKIVISGSSHARAKSSAKAAGKPAWGRGAPPPSKRLQRGGKQFAPARTQSKPLQEALVPLPPSPTPEQQDLVEPAIVHLPPSRESPEMPVNPTPPNNILSTSQSETDVVSEQEAAQGLPIPSLLEFTNDLDPKEGPEIPDVFPEPPPHFNASSPGEAIAISSVSPIQEDVFGAVIESPYKHTTPQAKSFTPSRKQDRLLQDLPLNC